MLANVLKSVPAVAVLAFVAACAANSGSDTSKTAAAGPTNDPAVRKAIESADSAFSVAFKNLDAAGAASFYAEDAVSRPPNAEPMVGKAAIEKGYGDVFKSLGKVLDFTASAKDVDTYADHVVEIGEYKMSFQPAGAKEAMPDHGGYMNYWKKQSDGSWKIARDLIVSANPLPTQGPPAPAKK